MTGTTLADHDRYRVVIVDDDPDVAQLTRVVLERRANCEVRVLASANSIAEVLAEFHPDVLVTDIEMPGMTGIGLLGIVRAQQPGLPVIMMTAHASAEYAIGALRGEADEFFTKPVPSAELVAAVIRLAEKCRSARVATTELERAAEVQRGLLPHEAVGLPGYQLAGGCSPARAVGGDFFDWYPLDGGVAFTLADVMGKGIGAAIIAASVRAVLRSELDKADIAVGFAAAAARLEADLGRAASFVTVFHGQLDVSSAVVSYVDAGHGLSLVVREKGGVKRLATTSLPFGLSQERGSGWRVHRVSLEPGDTLVSVSDGVLDLFDGTLASLDQVERLSRSAPSAQSVVDQLLALTSDGAPDDVTVVALRRDAVPAHP